MLPKKLQKFAGHASSQTTIDLYGHLWKTDRADGQVVEAAVDSIINAGNSE